MSILKNVLVTISSFASVAIVLPMQATAVIESSTLKCQVSFPHDSVDFDREALKSCLSKIPEGSTPEVLTVYATASVTGPWLYNQDLSARRGQTLRTFGQEVYGKDIHVEVIAGGENVQGRAGTIMVVATQAATSQKKLAALNSQVVQMEQSLKTATAPKTTPNHVRLGVIGGQSAYRLDDSRYDSIGAEVSYLRDLAKSRLQLEAGITAIKHSRDDVLDLYSLGALAGVYTSYKWFVAGLRGQATATTNSAVDKSVYNPGGEVRMGYQKNGVSVLGFGGLSKDFRGFGVSAGLMM